MPRTSLAESRMYRAVCASCLALLAYVVARAPLWSEVMAGARVHVDGGDVALLPGAWECSERPHRCTTTLSGDELALDVGALGDHPFMCHATYRARPVSCAVRLWYAPRLKPFLELGQLPDVSFAAAMRERPWRMLDRGLLGEEGPLHLWAGVASALVLAPLAGARIQRGGVRWLLRVGLSAVTGAALCVVWFVALVLLGYVD